MVFGISTSVLLSIIAVILILGFLVVKKMFKWFLILGIIALIGAGSFFWFS